MLKMLLIIVVLYWFRFCIRFNVSDIIVLLLYSRAANIGNICDFDKKY